jgi:hypothetical protein
MLYSAKNPGTLDQGDERMTVEARKDSVVTPERYATGISYEQWMASIDRNQEKFVENYGGADPDPGDVAAIKALMALPDGPAKCLAIGEAWCPDVVRGMPTMARLAEATGLDLKIVFRDQNLDIMNEFLYKGEFQSIPTFVFYTSDHRYIGHWIERAQKARDEMPLLRAISTKMRDESLSEEERKQHAAEYEAFQRGPVWAGWRDAQVREIRELLEANCK